MEFDWLTAGITILAASLTGGVTNRIAVTMLFKPSVPPRIFRREVKWLQGAIPKNQDRLAASIGNTVSGSLLTSSDIKDELRGLEEEFLARLREMMSDLVSESHPPLAEIIPEPALQEVRSVLVNLLAKGRDAAVVQLKETAQARDAASRQALVEWLRSAAGKSPKSGWTEMLHLVPPDRIAGWLAALLNSGTARALSQTAAVNLVDSFLSKPIGRLDRYVGPEAAFRAAESIGPGAWEWVATQVPRIAQRIQVADRIADNVNALPPDKLGSLIHGLGRSELQIIVRLGYVIGAAAGGMVVLMNYGGRLFP